jgi:hypothetical protein
MARSLGDFLLGFGSELGSEALQQIREDCNTRLEEAASEERIIGIEKATAALCEAKVEDEKIIYLLQKHWDLRPSEVERYLRYEKRSNA